MAYPSYWGAFSALTNYIMTSTTAYTAVTLSFGMGENIDDYSVTGEDSYPRVFLELPIQTNYFTNRIDWVLSLTVTDIEQQDRSDESDKLSRCWDIGNDLFEKFKKDEAYFLKDEYNNMSLTQFGNDYTCGWRYEYTFTQAIPMNTCDILTLFPPPTTTPPEPPPVVDSNYLQITYNNANNLTSFSVGDWNNILGSTFTGVTYPNNYTARLFAPSVGHTFHLNDGAFSNNDQIDYFFDDYGFLDSVGLNSFEGSSIKSFSSLSAQLIRLQAFNNCASLTGVTASGCTTVEGAYVFGANSSIQNYYFPSVTDMGGSVSDDLVFNGTTAQSFDLTIPTALLSDGDIAYLQSFNTVNLILV